MHPWELDARQPKVKAPLLRRLRHYMGIRNMEKKLVSLLETRKFGTVREYLEDRIGAGNVERRA